jgi:hypothetical protein
VPAGQQIFMWEKLFTAGVAAFGWRRGLELRVAQTSALEVCGSSTFYHYKERADWRGAHLAAPSSAESSPRQSLGHCTHLVQSRLDAASALPDYGSVGVKGGHAKITWLEPPVERAG